MKMTTVTLLAAALVCAAFFSSASAHDPLDRCACPYGGWGYGRIDGRAYHGSARLGVLVDAIDPKAAAAMGLAGVRGAFIVDVAEGGPAFSSGLSKGDVIVKVGDSDVADADALAALLGGYPSGSTVVVSVNRSGRVEAVPVVLSGTMTGESTVIVSPGADRVHDAAPYHRRYGDWGHYRDRRYEGRGGLYRRPGVRDCQGYDRIYTVKQYLPDLTAEQEKRIDAILTGYERAGKKSEAALQKADVELDEILSAESVGLDRAKAKVKEIEAVEADMAFAEIKAFEDVKKVLTPAQRRLFTDAAGYRGRPGCGY